MSLESFMILEWWFAFPLHVAYLICRHPLGSMFMDPRSWDYHVCAEIHKPVIYFAQPGMIFYCVSSIALSEAWYVELWFALLTLLHCWFLSTWRTDKWDDRWKKRRQKSLAKVKQLGGKLVVVPTPAPVPN